VSLSANSIFSVDIGATTVGSYDSLNVTGSISLSGSTLSLDTIGGFANNPGDTFYVMLNNGADPVTGIFGNDIGGSVTSIDGYVFNVNYAANAPGGDGGSNDVALTLMAVPEPGSAALLLGGLAALTLRRRRKA
jgi:hypothetical protein